MGNELKNKNIKGYYHEGEGYQEYIVDETLIKVGSEYVWLWVSNESNNRQILALF